jgi:dTMP kinase
MQEACRLRLRPPRRFFATEAAFPPLHPSPRENRPYPMTHSPRFSSPNSSPQSSSAPQFPSPAPRDPGRKGWLIVFEGIDGAGKSTQVEQTAAWLNEAGLPAVRYFEPTRGPIGRRIRELAAAGRDSFPPEEEFRLFLEDRRWNVETHLRPALDRGDIILLDRYYLSSIAYQGALGLDPERIRRENEKFAPLPDRVYLFEFPPARAHERIRALRGDEPNLFERTDYLMRVAKNFDAMSFPGLLRLDATQSVEAIQSLLRRDLSQILNIPSGA